MKLAKRFTAVALSALLVAAPLSVLAAETKEASVTKDEDVYLILNDDGSVKKQIVSCWLHSGNGLKNVTDKSDLANIVNVKSKLKPEQNGTTIKWNTDDEDVYYQGTIDKKPPVSVKISYKLDGKEINPQDLLGKSGTVTIELKFTNNRFENKTINGNTRKIYAPLAVAVVMNMPNDTFTNIDAGKATVLTDASNQIVSAVSLPGMKENFEDVFDKDIDDEFDELKENVSDTVTVTAKADHFAMPDIAMGAASSISGLKDIKLSDKVSDLSKGMDDLEDAAGKLKDGTSKLKDALGTFDDKMGTFKSSYGEFNDGVVKAVDGAKQLSDGTKKLNDATSMLNNKVTDELIPGMKNSAPTQKALLEKMDTLKKTLHTMGMDDPKKMDEIQKQVKNLQSQVKKTQNEIIADVDSTVNKTEKEVAAQIPNEINKSVDQITPEIVEKVSGKLSAQLLGALLVKQGKNLQETAQLVNTVSQMMSMQKYMKYAALAPYAAMAPYMAELQVLAPYKALLPIAPQLQQMMSLPPEKQQAAMAQFLKDPKVPQAQKAALQQFISASNKAQIMGAMQKISSLNPQEKAAVMAAAQNFEKLSPEQQKQIQVLAAEYAKLPASVKAQLPAIAKQMENLPADKKALVNAYLQLTPAEQQKVNGMLTALQAKMKNQIPDVAKQAAIKAYQSLDAKQKASIETFLSGMPAEVQQGLLLTMLDPATQGQINALVKNSVTPVATQVAKETIFATMQKDKMLEKQFDKVNVQIAQQKSAIQNKIDKEIMQPVNAMMKQLDMKKLEEVQNQVKEIQGLSNQLMGSMNLLTKSLYNPNDNLSNPKTLAGAIMAISVGTDTLNNGAQQLNNGMGKLNDGSVKVSDAIVKFKDATSTLAEKTGDLDEGMGKFKREGVDKLCDKDLVQQLTDATDIKDAMQQQADDFGSYSGSPKDAENNVRFVLKVDAPSAKHHKKAAPKAVEKDESIWEKIVNFFKNLF